MFETEYGNARQLVSWVLGLGERARVLEPPELVEEADERMRLDRRAPLEHARARQPAKRTQRGRRGGRGRAESSNGKRETPIRPERFARLVTLAGILIEAARTGSKLSVTQVLDNLQITETELREDIDVLNVVNFGGGSYVLYAEVSGDTIEVDPEPYGDNFAKPARLLPLEAKALVAAIDLLGDHMPEGSLQSAREQDRRGARHATPRTDGLQITTAIGDDSEIARVVSQAIAERRLLELEYYKENEDEFTPGAASSRTSSERPGGLVRALVRRRARRPALVPPRPDQVGDDARRDVRAARPASSPTCAAGRRPARCETSRAARVWISPERARWAREDRRVVEELADGAVVVELHYAGEDWLAGEILKEAGDAVVLEPEDARRAVLEAAEALAGAVTRSPGPHAGPDRSARRPDAPMIRLMSMDVLSGLAAHRRCRRTANNVANVNTEGYQAQRANLATSSERWRRRCVDQRRRRRAAELRDPGDDEHRGRLHRARPRDQERSADVRRDPWTRSA